MGADSATVHEVTYESHNAQPLIYVTDIDETLVDDPETATQACVAAGAVSLLGDDTIRGNGFADLINGYWGNDLLCGRDGDDQLFGDEGDDALNGGAGADLLDEGGGFDRASYATALAGVTIDLSDNANNTEDAVGDVLVSIELVAGSRYDDILSGSAQGDMLMGMDGDDVIYGQAGDDTPLGKSGNDILYGGDGNDWLDGGPGEDTIHAGTGDDWIVGQLGCSGYDGGDGVDTVDYSALAYALDLNDYFGAPFHSVEIIILSDFDDFL